MHTEIVDVQFVYSVKSLHKLKKKRNTYLNKLERAEMEWEKRKLNKEKRDRGEGPGIVER